MTTILRLNSKVNVRLQLISHKLRTLKIAENQTASLHQKSTSKQTKNQWQAGKVTRAKSKDQVLESVTSRNRSNALEEPLPESRNPVINVFMSTKAQQFPGLSGTKVYTLKTEQQVREGIQLLRAYIEHQPEKVVGFDTETRTKPGCDSNKVSVIQLACRDICLIIYIRRIVNEGLVFPHSLQLFLQDNDIKKVGVCAHRDSWALSDSYNIKCANVWDLKPAALKLGHRNTTLKSLASEYGNMKLNKQLHYKKWDNRELREKEVIYAAKDAIASYLVYFGMKKSRDTRIVSPDDMRDPGIAK